MSHKQAVKEFNDKLLKDLKTQGLTYKELMKEYRLTRWGARKLSQHDAVSHEKSGKEKIFYIEEETDSLLAEKLPVQEIEVNNEEEIRQTSKAKQTITSEASTYLKKLEEQVKNVETPETEYTEPENTETGFTAVIHETDPHFSAHVKNRSGETIYDTETAAKATDHAFTWYVNKIFDLEERGRNVDEVVLLLGGDLVEGETIYQGQEHKVEETLENQIDKAKQIYFKNIDFLSTVLDAPIKVVCISGNHGDLPVSSDTNADDLIYSQLEDMVGIADIEDVKFVRSDRSDGITFTFRDWKGYLCHGENRSNHIGTSSPQSDWLAMKDQYGFDAAWRGHYHNQKQENVNGIPVFMTNSRKPGDDYTDKIATFGVTGNALYISTDDEPVEQVFTQTEVLPDA